MPPSLLAQGKRRPQGMWKKKILQTGQCGKNKFSTLHTKFSTFKCGKIFLKKERRLEVYLYIYSNTLNNQKMIQGLQLAVLQEILLFKRWGKFLAVLSSDGKNQWPRPPSLAPSGQFTLRSPGDAAIGPAASRPVLHAGFPPDPRYGGRFPGERTATPARAVIGSSSVPRRCRWSGSFQRAVRLDGESAPVASSRRGGFLWPAKPNNMVQGRRSKGEGQAFHLFYARAQWPGRGEGSHSDFARRKKKFCQRGR